MNFFTKLIEQLKPKPKLPWEFQEENENNYLAKQMILDLYKIPEILYQNDDQRQYYFDFSLEEHIEIANLIVQQDANLGKLRKQLVPQKVSDELFWNNYFYQVELIKLKCNLTNKLAKTEIQSIEDDIQI